MNNNFLVVFVHGYTSSHSADWYPAISPMLKKVNYNFIIPDLPGGKQPHASEWLTTLNQVINQNEKPLILVGHSLGTRAVLLYLEKYRPKVEKVILIAAFANKLENAHRRNGEAYPDFFNHTVDLKVVKNCSKKFIVLHSKDDSSIPYEQGVEIAKDLSAKLIHFDDRDHFTEPGDAQPIFDVLQQKI